MALETRSEQNLKNTALWTSVWGWIVGYLTGWAILRGPELGEGWAGMFIIASVSVTSLLARALAKPPTKPPAEDPR
jgi:hypothetical protein